MVQTQNACSGSCSIAITLNQADFSPYSWFINSAAIKAIEVCEEGKEVKLDPSGLSLWMLCLVKVTAVLVKAIDIANISDRSTNLFFDSIPIRSSP